MQILFSKFNEYVDKVGWFGLTATRQSKSNVPEMRDRQCRYHDVGIFKRN